MNKTKKVLIALLSAACAACCAFGIAACSDDSGTTDDEIYAVYQAYAESGGTLSYSEWLASIKGDKGDKGDTGATGATGAAGASAYDIAVENGFEGTEEEWLASLVGSSGSTGATGAQGVGIASVSVVYDLTGAAYYLITYTDDSTQKVAIPSANITHNYNYDITYNFVDPDNSDEDNPVYGITCILCEGDANHEAHLAVFTETATYKVTVTDEYDLSMSGVPVVFYNSDYSFTVETDSSGTVEVTLPKGLSGYIDFEAYYDTLAAEAAENGTELDFDMYVTLSYTIEEFCDITVEAFKSNAFSPYSSDGSSVYETVEITKAGSYAIIISSTDPVYCSIYSENGGVYYIEQDDSDTALYELYGDEADEDYDEEIYNDTEITLESYEAYYFYAAYAGWYDVSEPYIIILTVTEAEMYEGSIYKPYTLAMSENGEENKVTVTSSDPLYFKLDTSSYTSGDYTLTITITSGISSISVYNVDEKTDSPITVSGTINIAIDEGDPWYLKITPDLGSDDEVTVAFTVQITADVE